MVSIVDRARDCGLPVDIVKLSLPALTTCEGALYNYSSIQRCCSPVCIRGRVSVFMHVSVTVSGSSVQACVCIERRRVYVHEPVFVESVSVSTCSFCQ
jgi:hypothetical protein